jgi:hypothetical protein
LGLGLGMSSRKLVAAVIQGLSASTAVPSLMGYYKHKHRHTPSQPHLPLNLR